MTTKRALTILALDAAGAAHVEACTGDQVRSSLIPHIGVLRAVDAPAVDRLLGSRTTSGDEWIEAFTAPARVGWAGKRYTQEVAEKLAALLAELDDLQTNCALAFHKTRETL